MRPDSLATLAEVLQGTPGPLRIRGGGTRALGPQDGLQVLDTGGLGGIALYEPQALTLVVGAGTPLAQVQALLVENGQMLPFEPPDLRAVLGRNGQSTIGGVVAANASGPRRVQSGACRDSLIGVRLVDGSGRLLASGGRVMKNVTGLDLARLMAGAQGTLGVLGEVAFKLLPRPEAMATVQIDGMDTDRACAAMVAALASPFGISAAAHLPRAARTLLRLEGIEGQVDIRANKLIDLLSGAGAGAGATGPARGCAFTVLDSTADPWPAIRDLAPLAGLPGDLWRLSLPPAQAARVAAALRQAGAGDGDMLIDWGGGLIHARVTPGTPVRACLSGAGHATMLLGSGQPVFHPEHPALARLAAGLRAQFDPRGILNAGLMDA